VLLCERTKESLPRGDRRMGGRFEGDTAWCRVWGEEVCCWPVGGEALFVLPPAPKLLFRRAWGSCTLPPPLPLLPDRCSDGDQKAEPPLPSSPLVVESIPDWPPLVLLLTVLMLLLLLLLLVTLLLLSDIYLSCASRFGLESGLDLRELAILIRSLGCFYSCVLRSV
jgi:hypothetical protein